MIYFLKISLFVSLVFPQLYTFSENMRLTDSSQNQKFPEVAIDENYIHLAWVSVSGNNKNIMYSRSDDFGESFSIPIQLNFVNNNIVAYSQSGPKVKIYGSRVYIAYTDDRSGYTSVYINISEDYGQSWQEEILISDTSYLNAYQDFEVDSNGNLHLVYYNYAANYALDDVRYRFSYGDVIDFSASTEVGIVNDTMEPCDCCQPDMKVDLNGDVYIAYRNNILNDRDTYLAIKRHNQDGFSENHRVSYFNDYISFCPSSGPTIDIKDSTVAVAYTAYYNQDAYATQSDLNNLDFTGHTTLNPSSSGFPNYPYILISDDIHIVWADQQSGNWDVYYGMKNLDGSEVQNIQKINDDDTNYTQKDQIICEHNDTLFLFWSDQRNGNHEIYFSLGQSVDVLLGDANQDQNLDVLDVVIIINFILGADSPTNIEFYASDINNDNHINIQDIILLINMIIN